MAGKLKSKVGILERYSKTPLESLTQQNTTNVKLSSLSKLTKEDFNTYYKHKHSQPCKDFLKRYKFDIRNWSSLEYCQSIQSISGFVGLIRFLMSGNFWRAPDIADCESWLRLGVMQLQMFENIKLTKAKGLKQLVYKQLLGAYLKGKKVINTGERLLHFKQYILFPFLDIWDHS